MQDPKSTKLFFLWLLLLLLSPAATSAADLAGDRSALLGLRKAVGGRTLLWNATDTTPCRWAGVTCEQNRVTKLRLPGVALSGEIPAGLFSNLTGLRTLSLRLNALTGQLPPDLATCTNLRNLYLQGNFFSGGIPASTLSSLTGLVRLNLAMNNFSGEIPQELGKLGRLRTLYLQDNRLAGTLPESLHLKKLEQFNVSNNLLNGSIPVQFKSFESSSFLGNSLCGPPLVDCVGTGGANFSSGGAIAVPIHVKRKGLSGGAIAGIVIGSLVGLLLLVFVAMFLVRKRGRSKSRSVDMTSVKPEVPGEKHIAEMEAMGRNGGGYGSGNRYSVAAAAAAAMTGTVKGGGVGEVGEKKLVFFGKAPRVFDLEELLRASAEVLGKGTYGTAYKAVLEAGGIVAVKRLRDVTISEKEFRERIETVGGMDHENLVPLRAYYYNMDEKLLVYDYMSTGSLSALLHGNKGAGRTPLNWEIRSSIALGAARGVDYLHSQGPNVCHGNIKSSNILLTQSYDARVSDFGLVSLVGPSSSPNRVAGYKAPEVTDPRKVSQKADVYSFGVMILELLTGKPPTHALLNDEGVDLPRWVQSVVREEWTSEVFDLELLRYQDVQEEMVHLLQLAIDCAAQYPDSRPSMAEVRIKIEELRRSSQMEDRNPPDLINSDKHNSSSL